MDCAITVMNFALGVPVSFFFSKALEIDLEKFCGRPRGLGSGGSCPLLQTSGALFTATG